MGLFLNTFAEVLMLIQTRKLLSILRLYTKGSYKICYYTRQMQGIVGRAFARIVNLKGLKLVDDVFDTCSNEMLCNAMCA